MFAKAQQLSEQCANLTETFQALMSNLDKSDPKYHVIAFGIAASLCAVAALTVFTGPVGGALAAYHTLAVGIGATSAGVAVYSAGVNVRTYQARHNLRSTLHGFIVGLGTLQNCTEQVEAKGVVKVNETESNIRITGGAIQSRKIIDDMSADDKDYILRKWDLAKLERALVLIKKNQESLEDFEQFVRDKLENEFMTTHPKNIVNYDRFCGPSLAFLQARC